jgi:hypothetical protein
MLRGKMNAGCETVVLFNRAARACLKQLESGVVWLL